MEKSHLLHFEFCIYAICIYLFFDNVEILYFVYKYYIVIEENENNNSNCKTKFEKYPSSSRSNLRVKNIQITISYHIDNYHSLNNSVILDSNWLKNNGTIYNAVTLFVLYLSDNMSSCNFPLPSYWNYITSADAKKTRWILSW